MHTFSSEICSAPYNASLKYRAMPPPVRRNIDNLPWSELTRSEKRRRRRATLKYRQAHANRERMRVEAFNVAFTSLRSHLPTTPPDKKMSKIEILRMAICYISYLMNELSELPCEMQMSSDEGLYYPSSAC